jgi:diguanylate cyclase (GGDEF)-like protein
MKSATDLKDQIETELAEGADPARLRALFAEYAEMMQSNLDVINAKLVMVDTLSITDAGTGVLNRRGLDARTGQELARARRESAPIGIIMIDIDRFKAYNDLYGHIAGDAAIKAVAESLASALKRPTDFVGRYGGEEFVAVLPCTDTEGARSVAETMRGIIRALQIDHRGNDGRAIITASFGVSSMIPKVDVKPPSLFDIADKALYLAKSGGRDQVRVGDHLPDVASVSESRFLRAARLP